jgi:DNA polymerase-3 subunit gamma/tau
LNHFFPEVAIVFVMSQYLVLARKYRPKTFAEVIGQEPVVQTLKNAIRRKSTAHAYLFCGARGTGKTTLARILAKAINCSNLSSDYEPCNGCPSCVNINNSTSLDILEIDGASNRGIEDIKTIADSIGYCPAYGFWKVYIIDEVHMLTKEAFNALLKTLEEPPKHVKFIFATTEAHKIPATILSRCQKFTLRRHTVDAIAGKLEKIALEMGVSVDIETLKRIAQFSEGGLRDAESLFDQIISFSDGVITRQSVDDILGLMPEEVFSEIDAACADANVCAAFSIAERLFMQGKECSFFLDELQRHFKKHLFLLFSKKESFQYGQEQLVAILEMVGDAQLALKAAISQQVVLESLLLKIIRSRTHISMEAVAIELERMRMMLEAGPAATTSPQVKETPAATSVEALSADVKSDASRKAKHDTLVQFAAVELEAFQQRKPTDLKRR